MRLVGMRNDTAKEPKTLKRKVKVITYKGEKELRKGVERMLKDGWELEAQSTRRQVLSFHHGASVLVPGAGLLTRKQKHTVTFVRMG